MGVGLFDSLMIETTGCPSTITAKRRSQRPLKDAKWTEEKPKRRRAPKVRTGCLSCKRRRVKCDEAKPHCMRCLTSRTICDGYKGLETPKAPRLLVQRHPSLCIIAPVPLPKVRCRTEAEHRYFQIFKNETAFDLSGCFETHLWDRIVLQASEEEPFVLDAVLAITACSTSAKTTRESADHDIDLSVAALHSDFAMKQYRKALYGMRYALASDNSPRKTLLACLLVCCFEALSGNALAALAHGQIGHNLLQEWLASTPYSDQTKVGISSSAHHILEHDLLQAAYLFDLQLMEHFDTRHVDVHRALKHEGSDTIEQMPDSFADVGEATVYWHLIQRRASHFVWEATSAAQSTSCSQPHSEEDILLEDMVLSPTLQNDAALTPPSTYYLQADLRVEQQLYSRETLRWRQAFGTLYSQIKKASSDDALTAANTLFVLSISNEVSLSHALPMDLPNDNNISDFQEIVTMSRKIIETKQTQGHGAFVFELDVTSPLYMVTKWCRDSGICQEAVQLLRWYGCREGAWDKLKLVEMDTYRMESVGTPNEIDLESFWTETATIEWPNDQNGWERE